MGNPGSGLPARGTYRRLTPLGGTANVAIQMRALLSVLVLLVTPFYQPSPEVRVEKNVPARMRDGVVLRADVYRPAMSGRLPALLQRCGPARSEAGGGLDSRAPVAQACGGEWPRPSAGLRPTLMGTAGVDPHCPAPGRAPHAWAAMPSDPAPRAAARCRLRQGRSGQDTNSSAAR